MSSNIVAKMPGMINELCVSQGDKVEEGDVILIMESMKMHIPVESPQSGSVNTLLVKEGDEVAEGSPLAIVTAL